MKIKFLKKRTYSSVETGISKVKYLVILDNQDNSIMGCAEAVKNNRDIKGLIKSGLLKYDEKKNCFYFNVDGKATCNKKEDKYDRQNGISIADGRAKYHGYKRFALLLRCLSAEHNKSIDAIVYDHTRIEDKINALGYTEKQIIEIPYID